MAAAVHLPATSQPPAVGHPRNYARPTAADHRLAASSDLDLAEPHLRPCVLASRRQRPPGQRTKYRNDHWRHVKIGHGRSSGDVCPVRGVHRGDATSKLEASVQTTRLDPQASARA
jgi:hypothetical protein